MLPQHYETYYIYCADGCAESSHLHSSSQSLPIHTGGVKAQFSQCQEKSWGVCAAISFHLSGLVPEQGRRSISDGVAGREPVKTLGNTAVFEAAWQRYEGAVSVHLLKR